MSFTEEIISRCRDLAVKNYADDAVDAFLQDFPLKTLLKHLINSDLADEKLFQPRLSLQQVLSKKRLFLSMLNDPSNRQSLEQLVAHPYEEQREFLAAVIAQNTEAGCDILAQFAADRASPTITGFLKVIFLLLRDKESEVGLKISKWLTNVARALPKEGSLDYLLTGEQSQLLVRELLTCGEAVAEIRTFETLVRMANEAPRLYDAGEKLGYFSQGLELYRKYFDEILEKMNLVDVIGQMGSSEQGCSILCGHPAFKAIKKEALSKDADPFVSKALGVMLIELVNHDKIAYSFAFFKDLKLRLEEFFVAGFGEELYSCFDMIRSFSKSVEGFNVVYQTKTILSKLCLCCHSKTEAVQRRALDAVLSLLSAEKKHLDPSKKGKVVSLPQLNEDGRHVEHLLIYVGSPGLVNSYIDASDPTHLKDTMAFIIDNLMMPFVEVEVLLLNILSASIRLEPILNAFIRSSKSLDYLHGKLARGIEAFDAKTEFKHQLLHRISHFQETVKDSFYEMYLKEYKIREEQKRSDLLQYATSTG